MHGRSQVRYPQRSKRGRTWNAAAALATWTRAGCLVSVGRLRVILGSWEIHRLSNVTCGSLITHNHPAVISWRHGAWTMTRCSAGEGVNIDWCVSWLMQHRSTMRHQRQHASTLFPNTHSIQTQPVTLSRVAESGRQVVSWRSSWSEVNYNPWTWDYVNLRTSQPTQSPRITGVLFYGTLSIALWSLCISGLSAWLI